MVEVYGMVPAIEALDAAVKAANVTMVDVICVKGGLVCTLVKGDIGAVKAAIDAAAAAADRIGTVLSIHVIPRPIDSMQSMLDSNPEGSQKMARLKALASEESKPEDPKPQGPTDSEPEGPTGSEPEEPAASETEEAKDEQTPETRLEETAVENAAEEQKSGSVSSVYTEEELKDMTIAQLRSIVAKEKIEIPSPLQWNKLKKREMIQIILDYYNN